MSARIAHLFATPEELSGRVGELGAEIAGAEPEDRLLLVTMLKGGVPFLADLVRTMSPEVVVDFLALSAYEEGENPPGLARIVKDLAHPVAGKHVIVVEDVVDTGLSLAFLLRSLEARDPASVKVCALLDREAKRLVDLPVAYRGFELGAEFIVGYGLDFLGLYRNLPCLVAVDDLDTLRNDPEALGPQLREWGIWH